MRNALARLCIGAAILLTVLPAPVSAAECLECFKFFDDEWCQPVGAGRSGFTECTSPEEASCCCRIRGNPCTIDGGAGGGGGGGGWGGGGSVCSGGGAFCPAQCFSCGGGGTY